MSNWVNDEAQKYAQAKTQKESGEYLINFSNYWGNLIQQIERDVEKINNHPVWKAALGNRPITTGDADTGYQINKITFPAVVVAINNQGKYIEVKTTKKKQWESDSRTSTEKLDVESDGERIYLKRSKEMFFVPEQASQHILSPIVEAFNETL